MALHGTGWYVVPEPREDVGLLHREGISIE